MKRCYMILGLFICKILIFGGCTHIAATVSSPAISVYSAYEDRIPGNWALVIDESVKTSNTTVKPSGYLCSAHNYRLDIQESLATSIQETMSNTFYNVEVRDSLPSPKELDDQGLDGSILVRLESFQPRVFCQQSFFSGHCMADSSLSFGVVVRGPEGKIFATTAGTSRSMDGDSGAMCGRIAQLLADNFQDTARASLERLAERISNSRQIRDSIR